MLYIISFPEIKLVWDYTTVCKQTRQFGARLQPLTFLSAFVDEEVQSPVVHLYDNIMKSSHWNNTQRSVVMFVDFALNHDSVY